MSSKLVVYGMLNVTFLMMMMRMMMIIIIMIMIYIVVDKTTHICSIIILLGLLCLTCIIILSVIGVKNIWSDAVDECSIRKQYVMIYLLF